MPKVKPVNFNVNEVSERADQAERERSARIRALLQREPATTSFFGEQAQYLPPQMDENGNANPGYNETKEAAINYAILQNKNPDTLNYRKVAPLNPIGKAVAQGQTEFQDPESKAAALKILQYRRAHGGQ